MTRRLFVPAPPAADRRLRIAGPALRHVRALRLGPGERLLVFDAEGNEHEVEIDRITTRAAEATVVATRRPARESRLDLVLAPALLKGTKMDLVIEKATELGVRRIAPVETRHAVARGARVERWRRIAAAASEQSGRTRLPTVDPPVPLAVRLAEPWPGVRLLAWEEETSTRLARLPVTAAAVVCVIGPEGGLADGEVALARQHGFTPIALAPRILRAETASIAAAALCQHRWGDLG